MILLPIYTGKLEEFTRMTKNADLLIFSKLPKCYFFNSIYRTSLITTQRCKLKIRTYIVHAHLGSLKITSNYHLSIIVSTISLLTHVETCTFMLHFSVIFFQFLLRLTHSWSSHQDSWHNNLRYGTFGSHCWFSKTVAILIKYWYPIEKFPVRCKI